MLDVAGVASLSPRTPPAAQRHLVSQPYSRPEHQDTPEHHRPCAGGGDTELGTTVGTPREAHAVPAPRRPSGRCQSGRGWEEPRELTNSANEGESARHPSPVRGMRAWGQRSLAGWGLGVCLCRTGSKAPLGTAGSS